MNGLRPATLDDAAGIEAVQRSIGPRVDDWVQVIEHDPDAVLLVADHPEAGVVGYALAVLDDGGTDYDGELVQVAVAAEHRQQGIGGALVAAAMRQLWEAGGESVRAFVVPETVAASWLVRAGGRVFAEREVVRDGARFTEVGLGWADMRDLA